MSNGLLYSATYDAGTGVCRLLDRVGNEICAFSAPFLNDDENKPLMLKSLRNGSTVALKSVGTFTGTFEISLNGSPWTSYMLDSTGVTIPLNKNAVVSFRRTDNDGTVSDLQNHVRFVMSGEIEAWHNANSMMRVGDSVPSFLGLFNNCSSLVKAPLLPSLTVGANSYYALFNGCTGLTKAPALPATTLGEYCYCYMFYGCTGLTEAPALPATTLANYCYYHMFGGCTGLTKASDLVAPMLYSFCYYGMYLNCASLVNPPQILATQYKMRQTSDTSYGYACGQMFKGCTALIKSPVLKITGGLHAYLYQSMFSGCTSLTEVRCYLQSLPQDTSVTNLWLEDVASSGTLYADPYLTWGSGASGLPSGWVFKDIYEGAFTDDSSKPLTFKLGAVDSGVGSIILSAVGSPTCAFETSTDGGVSWQSYTLGREVTVPAGDDGIQFRRSSGGVYDASNYVKFSIPSISGWYPRIVAVNNTNSMISDSFESITSAPNYAFYHLFDGCVGLIRSASLPCTSMSTSCYEGTFANCTYLKESPVLPAPRLSTSSSLTQNPNYCYRDLFRECSRLEKITCMAKYLIFVLPSGTGTGSQLLANTANWIRGVSSSGTFYYPKLSDSSEIYGDDQYTPNPNKQYYIQSSNWQKPTGWTYIDLNA